MEAPRGAEKEVALKVVHPHLTVDRDFVLMFLDEMRLAMAMAHRNIVQTFDAGRAEGRYYMVMELVRGCSLSRLLRRLHPRPLPIEIALFVGMEVAAALDYAHRFRAGNAGTVGLIHRDVSPSNILLSLEGDVKLADFGVAKAAGRLTVSYSNLVKGKLDYMPPEQALGEEEARSDLFSLGAVLYEMTTGQPFRRGVGIEEVQRGTALQLPPSAHARIPPALEAIILRCLSPSVEDRPRAAEELRAALSEESFLLQLRTGIGQDLHGRLQSFLAANIDLDAPVDPRAAKVAKAVMDEARAVETDPGFTLSDLLARAEDPRAVLRSGEIECPTVPTESAPGVPALDEAATALTTRVAAPPLEPAARALPAPEGPATEVAIPAAPSVARVSAPPVVAPAERSAERMIPGVVTSSTGRTPPPTALTREQARDLGWVASRRRVALAVAAVVLPLGAAGAWVALRSPPPAVEPRHSTAGPRVDLGQRAELPRVDLGWPAELPRVDLPRAADLRVADLPAPAPPHDAGPRPDDPRAVPVVPVRPGAAIRRRPGFLDLNAVPWAVVTIDGRRWGETPLQGVALAPGSHRVRLESPTRKVSRTLVLQIRSGQTTRRVVNLAP